MSISLILKPDGLMFEKRWVYDEKIKKGDYEYNLISGNMDDSYLLSLLNTTVVLEEGFTVRDWFKFIINYPIYQKLDLFTLDFLEEYYDCPSKGCFDPDGKLMEVILQKIISTENYEPDKEELYECEIFMDIYGIYKDKDTHYGIEFTPLKEYLDIPMKLSNGLISKTTAILKEVKENKKKKKTYSDYTYDYKREDVKVYYTLFDVITSFIYEISFFGSPKKRDEKNKELTREMEDIRSGKAKTYPLDIDKLINGSDDGELEVETE